MSKQYLPLVKLVQGIAIGLTMLGSPVVLANAGDFDPSYNHLGFTRDFIPDSAGSGGLAIDSVGRIVSAGFYYLQSDRSEHLLLWRRLADGSPDTTFGIAGVAYLATPPLLLGSANNSIATDSGDRTVMITATDTSYLIHRVNADGSPDLSFSGTGSREIPLRPFVGLITGVAVQPDNRIVGVGGAVNPASGRAEFVVYRLQENGDLDSSFGGTGLIYTQITPGGGIDTAAGVALQADGKIVVAGRVRTSLPGSYLDFAIARYLSSGALDPDFGDAGKVVFSILDNNFGRKVAIQPDRKIVVAGSVCRDLGGGNMYCYHGASRVDDHGTLDPSFGGTGKVYVDVGGDWGGFAYNLALQSDGKIVVVGIHQRDFDFTLANATLVRFQPDGSPDPTFGFNGISETNYGYASSGAGNVSIQSDGQIVVNGGTTAGLARSSVVTARYLAVDTDGRNNVGSDPQSTRADVLRSKPIQ